MLRADVCTLGDNVVPHQRKHADIAHILDHNAANGCGSSSREKLAYIVVQFLLGLPGLVTHYGRVPRRHSAFDTVVQSAEVKQSLAHVPNGFHAVDGESKRLFHEVLVHHVLQ